MANERKSSKNGSYKIRPSQSKATPPSVSSSSSPIEILDPIPLARRAIRRSSGRGWNVEIINLVSSQDFLLNIS